MSLDTGSRGSNYSNFLYFCIFLECIKVWLGVMVWNAQILMPCFLLSVRLLELVPGCWKCSKLAQFFIKSWVFLAQWMNEFHIVEFHVFPTKDDHLWTLGVVVVLWLIVIGKWLQIHAIAVFEIQVYLVWMGLICLSTNLSKFVFD